MQSLRERLSLLLIVLLPFHAFLVTVLTKVLAGPGHAPLTVLALWKEGLLALVLLLAGIEILLRLRKKTPLLGAPAASLWKPDKIDGVIAALIVLSGVVTLLTHRDPVLYAFGFRYDFVPLVAFIILRRVEWSGTFFQRVQWLLLWAGVVVATAGLVSLVLPQRIFTWLGYSDLHSLYVPGGPVAAFQQIGGSAVRRMQSVMSGPNHLGLWMLLPLSVSLRLLLRSKGNRRQALVPFAMTVLFFVTILLTFSRTAWIASGVLLVCALAYVYPRDALLRWLVRIGGFAMLLLLLGVMLWPSTVLRLASSRDHVLRPFVAIQTIIAHPLGMGLGTAGPASNRISDACVHLEEGSDPSWAADRPDLCVFVGAMQIQPADRDCQCPFLPENWYLQIGVELGVLGLILYLTLTILMLSRLRTRSYAFLPFAGVVVGSFFLHAWEDAALAYTTWMLAAIALSLVRRPEHEEVA